MISMFKKKIQPGLSPGRIEALADSIFGFAITLLVLAFIVPELSEAQLAKGELYAYLFSLLPKFITYLASAFVIAIFWIGHSIFFTFVKRSDRVFMLLNVLFVVAVAFFPFPVALLGKYPFQHEAVVLYGATLVVIGILFACMWRYATRGRFLMDHRLSDALIQKGSVIVWVAPLVYFCAVILSFLAVEASILIYLLVPVFYVLPGAVDELVEAAA